MMGCHNATCPLKWQWLQASLLPALVDARRLRFIVDKTPSQAMYAWFNTMHMLANYGGEMQWEGSSAEIAAIRMVKKTAKVSRYGLMPHAPLHSPNWHPCEAKGVAEENARQASVVPKQAPMQLHHYSALTASLRRWQRRNTWISEV